MPRKPREWLASPQIKRWFLQLPFSLTFFGTSNSSPLSPCWKASFGLYGNNTNSIFLQLQFHLPPPWQAPSDLSSLPGLCLCSFPKAITDWPLSVLPLRQPIHEWVSVTTSVYLKIKFFLTTHFSSNSRTVSLSFYHINFLEEKNGVVIFNQTTYKKSLASSIIILLWPPQEKLGLES